MVLSITRRDVCCVYYILYYLLRPQIQATHLLCSLLLCTGSVALPSDVPVVDSADVDFGSDDLISHK